MFLVEKPLAKTSAEAKKIADAAKKNKRKLMVGMNLALPTRHNVVKKFY
jgi:predicted dehydrogenase